MTDTAYILNLWNSGKDTLSIAHTLKTDEASIYNALSRLTGDTEPYRYTRSKAWERAAYWRNRYGEK